MALRKELQQNIFNYLLNQPKSNTKNPDLNFDVLITTNERIINDIEFIKKFKWQYLVMDEAHRLKNENSVLYTNLMNLNVHHKLLLTGTPIETNINELWTLLHFIMPRLFNNKDNFISWFTGVNWTDASMNYLYTIVRPFILRRLKADVL